MDYLWYEDSSRRPTWTDDFPIVGQGTVFFNIIRGTSFAIVIRPAGEAPPWEWMALEVHKGKAVFLLGKYNGKPEVLSELEQDGVGFEPNEETSYWFSFDRDHLVVKYGKGYCMVETTILEHFFLKTSESENDMKQTREKLTYLFNPISKKVIEFYDCKPVQELAEFYAGNELILSKFPLGGVDVIDHNLPKLVLQQLETAEGRQAHATIKSAADIKSRISFSQYPLVQNWPFLVLDSNKLSLLDLDQNEHMFSASLPPACQELYANVACGENIDLDWPPGQPAKLSNAIRYSINTEGKTLYNKLKEKATEFGESPNETYLRVTLGTCRGNSPGIPYVLEIWPYEHYSPIHNHGNSYAIIKVVHGSINVHIHNKKMKKHDQEPLRKVTISKGDVTWISPNWYQTHQLINDTSGDYCATIQCYQYGNEDQHHWPYFNYVSDCNQMKDFLPNSDFQFISLRKKLLEEYEHYLKMGSNF